MVSGSDFVTGIFAAFFIGLKALWRRLLEPATTTGLRDLERARFSILESDPSPSLFSLPSSEIAGGDVTCCLREEERVRGPT